MTQPIAVLISGYIAVLISGYMVGVVFRSIMSVTFYEAWMGSEKLGPSASATPSPTQARVTQ